MSERSKATRRAARLELDAGVAGALHDRLPLLAERTVTAITAEVPSYSGTLTGQMREKIETAVQIALGTFLQLIGRSQGNDPSTPLVGALEAAYALGSGEARSGRSMDALLAAYRVGARVSWREMSTTTVQGGLSAATVAQFAELLFAYIDELSAASVAGHADELASAGRARRRNLERLTQRLLAGEPEEVLLRSAESADWPPPQTLTVVLLPRANLRATLARLHPHTLESGDDPPAGGAGEDTAVLLVPDTHGDRRRQLARVLHGRRAVLGPARPWAQVASSYQRAVRALSLGLRPADNGPALDTEEHLAELVLSTDPEDSPTCAPGSWRHWRRCRPAPPTGSPRRCAPGCCTRAGATTSPPASSCTRRPSATGWASSASCTASASPIRRPSSTSLSPWPSHPGPRPTRHRPDRTRPLRVIAR